MEPEKSVTDRVKHCVIEALQLNLSIDDLADDEALFEGGLGLNSITTLEVVAALEKEFGIEVPDEDLTPELIESVRTLAHYAQNVSSSSISSLSGMPP